MIEIAPLAGKGLRRSRELSVSIEGGVVAYKRPVAEPVPEK
jgi:hypothetical protein